MRKPGDRPRTGETRLCLLTWDPGMVRSKSNNNDFLRSQINRFEPAIVFLKIETRSCLVTTLNVGAGEGETGRPPGRCWSPKKFPRGERSAEQGEQNLKGDVSSFLYKTVSL